MSCSAGLKITVLFDFNSTRKPSKHKVFSCDASEAVLTMAPNKT